LISDEDERRHRSAAVSAAAVPRISPTPVITRRYSKNFIRIADSPAAETAALRCLRSASSQIEKIEKIKKTSKNPKKSA
jgi:hypothetical protein